MFVCLYDAVEGERQVRPSMVLWMCDEAATISDEMRRSQWYGAAMQGKRQLAARLAEWGITHDPWYADNTREPLRDETFRAWGRLVRSFATRRWRRRPRSPVVAEWRLRRSLRSGIER